MLQADNLTKRYGETLALDGVTLTVEPGEVLCLLGANGAGKTTTINLFLNFIAPSAGTARVAGLDVTRHPLESKRHLAYIPEQVTLYRNLTGLENLAYFAALAGRDSLKEAQLRSYLADAGLPEEAASRRVATYSKGMRQKIGICDRAGKEGQRSPAGRADLWSGSQSLERILSASTRPQSPRGCRAHGHARLVSCQRSRHARWHHETRPPRGYSSHQ